MAGSDQFKKDVEALIARVKLGGGWGDTDEGTKAAQAFARDAKAVKHELKADFDPDKVDLDEIKVLLQRVPSLPSQGR